MYILEWQGMQSVWPHSGWAHHTVVWVANWQVEWMVLYMTEMVVLLLPSTIGKYIAPSASAILLMIWSYSTQCQDVILDSRNHGTTHTSLPCKVSGHDIAPLMLAICIEINIWTQVELPSKIRISQHRRDNRFRVAMPDLIACPHPAGRALSGIVRQFSYQTLPGNVTKHRQVNDVVHILMGVKWPTCIEFSHCLCP